MRRLECLDGLRGVLAMYVLLSHMAPFAAVPAWVARPMSHGEAAVDVFFILSGMVIVRSLQGFQYAAPPFLIARVGRIFPVFLAVFPFAAAIQVIPTGFALMPWIGPDSLACSTWSGGWRPNWAAEIAAHLTMTHGLFPDAVLPNVWVSFLGAAWSLSTEWQFYMVVALLAGPLGRGRISTAHLIVIFLGLAAAGIAWQGTAPSGWGFSRAFLPNKAQYFALGIAAAVLQRRPDAASSRGYAMTLGAVLLECGVQGGVEKMAAPLVWTACLAAEMRLGGRGTAMLATLLRRREMLWLGAASYCIYLVNGPAQKLLGVFLARLSRGDAAMFTAIWIPGAILLPLVLSWMLHVTVEQAGQRWGKARSLRVRVGSGA